MNDPQSVDSARPQETPYQFQESRTAVGRAPPMFEQKITPRDIMTSRVCTVQPTDRVKGVIALPGVRSEPDQRRLTVDGEQLTVNCEL